MRKFDEKFFVSINGEEDIFVLIKLECVRRVITALFPKLCKFVQSLFFAFLSLT